MFNLKNIKCLFKRKNSNSFSKKYFMNMIKDKKLNTIPFSNEIKKFKYNQPSQIKAFTFKFSNDKIISKNIILSSIKNVNENIDKIIEKFKKHQTLNTVDTGYFIENCLFYNFDKDKKKFIMIFKILCFLIKSTESTLEIKNNSSNNLKRSLEVILNKNNGLLKGLGDFLEIKEEFEKFQFKSFDWLNLFSNLIGDYFNSEIYKMTTEKKISFIIDNYKSLINFIEIPIVKIKVESLLTSILTSQKMFYSLKNENREMINYNNESKVYEKIYSDEFQEIFYLFFLNVNRKIRDFSEEIFLKNYLLKFSEDTQINKENENTIPDLNFPFLMLNKLNIISKFNSNKLSQNSKNDNFLSKDYLNYIDKNMDILIEYFTKNFNNINYFLRFFDRLSLLLLQKNKSSYTSLREFPNIVLYINYSLDHSYDKFKENMDEKLKEQSNLLKCLFKIFIFKFIEEIKKEKHHFLKINEKFSDYTNIMMEQFIDKNKHPILFNFSYYPQYKTYIYCENEELKTNFDLLHENCYKFLENLRDYSINLQKNNFFIFCYHLLEIANSSAINCINSKNFEIFFENNFQKLYEISRQKMNNLLFVHKLIISWIYYGKNSKEYEKNLNMLLIYFLKSFSESREKRVLISTITSIFYHLLVNEFNNHDILSNYCNKISNCIRDNSDNQFFNLFRLNNSFEILKINHPDIYSQSTIKLKDLERIIKIINEEEGGKRRIEIKDKIWWNKDYFDKNKYSVNYIFDYIKKNSNFDNCEFLPKMSDIYFSDFLIGKKKYIEFVGPLNINNKLDIDHIEFNYQTNKDIFAKKIIMKKKIFESYDCELTLIPFEEILQDINNLKRYI